MAKCPRCKERTATICFTKGAPKYCTKCMGELMEEVFDEIENERDEEEKSDEQ